MIPVHFSRNGLHVGYLAQDWSDVWFQSSTKIDDNGNEVTHYDYRIRGPHAREITEPEIKWHTHYHPDNCEAATSKPRKELQHRFLTEAYQYLSSKDEDEIEAMEDKWDEERINFPRFKTWFGQAKKFKKARMRQRAQRRVKRTQEARDNGVPEELIEQEVASDSSDSEADSDSAYGSEIGHRRATKTPNSDMPPPPLPRKRKSTSDGSGDRNKSSKKMRLSNVSRMGNRGRGSTLHMSGTLSNGSNGCANSSRTSSMRARSIANSADDNEGDDYEDMDVRNPLDYPTPAPGLPNGVLPRSSLFTRSRSLGTRSPHRLMNRGSPRNENDLEQRARRHEREQSAIVEDDDEALQMGIRASQEPQAAGTGEGVLDSIEDDGEDSLDVL